MVKTSALLAVLTIPLWAQSFRLTSNIPFEFVLSGRSMPSGDYSIKSESNLVTLTNTAANESALAIANRSEFRATDPAAATKLVFNRYGDRYFLSEVVDGYRSAGMHLPMTRMERELASSASIAKPEKVTVLAQLKTGR